MEPAPLIVSRPMYDQIHRLHRLNSIARKLTTNWADAQDAVQEAMVSLLEVGKDPLECDDAYLTAVVKNKVYDAVRSRKREGTVMAVYDEGEEANFQAPDAWREADGLVSLDRCRRNQHKKEMPLDQRLRGGVLPLVPCPVCADEFKPYVLQTRNGRQRKKTCGKPTCAAQYRERTAA